ncbi:Uncharacterised protein [uncultured archaeon]|nr:Uncharacterised protein [uncultured archaeon]
MSVTSSEFVESGAGQFTTTYEIPPGKGRDIEVRMRANQIGKFDVQGRIIYYFGDDSSHPEDYTRPLTIVVRADSQTTPNATQNNGNWLPGFEVLTALAGILALVLYLKKKKPQ